MFAPERLPQTLRIMHTTSRLAFADSVDEGHFRFWIMTSDEFAQALARACPHWVFFQPDHHIAVGGDTLLDILVTSRGDKSRLPRQPLGGSRRTSTSLPSSTWATR